MWVGHLGGHVEPEVLVIVHITVSQPDEQTAPLDEGLFKQHRLQGWIQLFPYLGGRRQREGERGLNLILCISTQRRTIIRYGTCTSLQKYYIIYVHVHHWRYICTQCICTCTCTFVHVHLYMYICTYTFVQCTCTCTFVH